MARKKPSARNKSTKLSPFAQASKHLADARSLAKKNHHQKAWLMVQDAVCAFKPLADKGASNHILAYIDALSTAGLIAMTLGLPNKSTKLLNESVSLLLEKSKSEPQLYVDSLVSALMNLSPVIDQSNHSSLKSKAIEHMKSAVTLLAQLNVGAKAEFRLEHYDALGTLIDALTNSDEIEQNLSYFDSLHRIAQSLPLLDSDTVAIEYALKCLQHACALLSCQSYDQAIAISEQAQKWFDDISARYNEDHWLESSMVQMVQAEALLELEQFNAAEQKLTTLHTSIHAQYQLNPDEAANSYIELLTLWADVAVQLDNDDGGAEKLNQALSILQEIDHIDYFDIDLLSIDIYWQLGMIYTRQSHTDKAIQALQQAISIDDNIQPHDDDPAFNPIMRSIRQTLIPNLMMAQQWQQAVFQAERLMQNEQQADLIDGDIYKAFAKVITTLSDDMADDAKAVDCCRQVIHALSPLCGEFGH